MKINTPAPIGPIRCVDVSGVPAIGPTVEISINNGAFVAAAGSIGTIGSGYIYYTPTPAECSDLGFVVIKLSGTADEATYREEVEASPQGIPFGTSDATWLHVGPLRVIDSAGSAVTDLTGATVEVSITGSVWTSALGALTLIEAGYADYAPTSAEVASPGWLAVRVTGTDIEEVVFRVDVMYTGGSSISVSTPVGSTAVASTNDRWIPIVLSIDSADDVVITLTKGGIDFAVYCESQVLDTGHFAAWMAENSTAERVGSRITISLLPNGGWWGKSIEIRGYTGSLSPSTVVVAGDGFTARSITLGDSPTQRIVLAKIGTLWMVARNGDGFTRDFADRSAVSLSALNLLPNGGWNNTPDSIQFGGVELPEL